MVVCAWCETVIASRPGTRAVEARSSSATLGAGAVSHGMCPTCLDRQLAAKPVLAPPVLSALAR
jgi:hypothetical protein